MITSICPDSKLIEDYKQAIADGKTLTDMTADQAWVEHHIKECKNCKDFCGFSSF